ncbi:3-hydroxyacyl-CoA dehydrogenase [Pseudomonas sp. 3A(2025)]
MKTTPPSLPASTRIGVIGAGTMGNGIAAVALRAGHRVSLHDTRTQALDSAAEAIEKIVARWIKRGDLVASDQAEYRSRLSLTPTLEALSDCGLVIEAIIEDLPIKISVFSALEQVVSRDAILASNTSSISITAIGAGLQHPERLVGMHFFNPATVLPLVEIVSGEATDPQIAALIANTAAAWGKSPVHCRSTPGFIVNRVARPFYAEAMLALQEQACSKGTLDAALRDAGGFRMGPLELMDLIGHDTNFAVTRSVYNSFFQDARYKPSLVQQALVDAGWLGRKSGRGFHSYAEDAPAPAVDLAPASQAPDRAVFKGTFSGIEALISLASTHGLAFAHTDGEGSISVGDAQLQPSTGVTATQLAAAGAHRNVVLFDASFDYLKASLIVLAKADQCSDQALAHAVGLFQKLGKNVAIISDIPGLLVLRTLCMLANEAAEAVCHGIASAEDVDTAMIKGVNYPVGPLAWADRFGNRQVVSVLDHLAQAYPDGRYRPSALLRRKALTDSLWTHANSPAETVQ